MNPWLRLALVTMTVGGGFAGLAGTWGLLFKPEMQNAAYFTLAAGFLIVYGFITFAGLLFVHQPHRTFPLFVALSLQIPWISSPLLNYRCSAGFHVTVGLVGGRIAGGFYLGSDWQFGLFQPLPWGMGVNLAALLALILLAKGSHREGATH